MLTEEVLGRESQESLEGTGARNRRAYLLERVKYLGLGALAVVLFGLGGIAARSCSAPPRQATGSEAPRLLQIILQAPGDTMDFLAAAAIVLGFALGTITIVYQLARTVAGPPKAPKKPAATVRKFYQNCLPGTGGFDSVGLDGYVCLLDVAKQEVGDFEGFREYWGDVNRGVGKELKEHFAPERFDTVTVRVENVDVKKGSRRIATGTAKLEMDVKRQDFGVGGTSWHELGTVTYRVDCELGKVGDRWYVATPTWTGELLESTSQDG